MDISGKGSTLKKPKWLPTTHYSAPAANVRLFLHRDEFTSLWLSEMFRMLI